MARTVSSLHVHAPRRNQSTVIRLYARCLNKVTMQTSYRTKTAMPSHVASKSRLLCIRISAGENITDRQTTKKKKRTMEINERTAPVSQQPDQNSISLDLMDRMRMHGMSEAFRESLAGTVAQAMTPDSFLYMLLSREWDYRSQAAVTRMTKNAAFRYKAYLEEIDYNVSRGLDRNQMERLSTLDFVKAGKNLFITGPSGTGKSFLACALGHEACKKGIRTLYANASKLLGQLKVAKVKNNLEAEMKKIERAQMLILDDLFLVPLDPKERSILLEIVEDRHERKSIIITSQYPHTSWYDMVGDQTVADAILDRIIHSAHTIELTGESMRKLKAKKG